MVEDYPERLGLTLTVKPVNHEWTQHAIEWNIPSEVGPAPLTLAVYDLNGRLVEELTHGSMQQGSYRLVWPTNSYVTPSAGSYFCILKGPESSVCRRIIVVK